jgi:hypothetical protein
MSCFRYRYVALGQQVAWAYPGTTRQDGGGLYNLAAGMPRVFSVPIHDLRQMGSCQ